MLRYIFVVFKLKAVSLLGSAERGVCHRECKERWSSEW